MIYLNHGLLEKGGRLISTFDKSTLPGLESSGLESATCPVRWHTAAFSLVELLVTLALALALMAAAAPLFVSLGQAAVREADDTIGSLQGRVAMARLERDLRIASAAGCPFAASGPVLEASPCQIVFLQPCSSDEPPLLIEWEIVAAGSLMRRWGTCPSTWPAAYRHTLYCDHKTMLEGLQFHSCFRYVMAGGPVLDSVEQGKAAFVEAVLFEATIGGTEGRGPVRVSTVARVGE